MGRPFAVVGFTMFASLFFISILGANSAVFLIAAALILLPIFLIIKALREYKAVITALIVAVVCSAVYLSAYNYFYLPSTNYLGEEVIISGEVTDYADYNYNNYYYEIKVKEINSQIITPSFKIRMVYDEEISALPDDEISFKAKIYELGSSSRFSKLNFISKGVFLGASVKNEPKVIKSDAKSFNYYLKTYRQKIVYSLKSLMPADNAALAAAVLIGDKSFLESQTLENINQIGISHIICVSGLHLSILGFGVIRFFRFLHFSRKVRYLTGAGFILIFMALCGFSASVVRAGIMFLIYIFAELILAESDSLNSLGLAAIIILINPFSAGNIGFIFSFTSTFAIITFGAKAVKFFKSKFDISSKTKIIKAAFSVFEILIISLCVNVFCLPFSILIFGRINFISLFANVLILPFASLLVISTALSAALGLIPLGVIKVIAYPAAFLSSLLCAYVLKLSEALSEISSLNTVFSGKSALIICAAVLIAAAVLILLKKKSFRFYAISLMSIFLFVIAAGAFSSFSEYQKCEITIHSLSGGACISIKTAEDFALIDCANDSFSINKIKNSLSSSFSADIDYFILTSAKRAESGKAEAVINNFKVKNVIAPESFEKASVLSENTSAEFTYCDYARIKLDNGVELIALSGDAGAVLIKCKGQNVLFVNTADIDISSLPEEMQAYNYLIVKGKVNNYIVKSSLNGIIEIAYSADEEHEKTLLNAGYNFYSTSDNKDIKIIIDDNKTIIGRVNEWQ